HPRAEELIGLASMAALIPTGRGKGIEPSEGTAFALLNQLTDSEAADFLRQGRLMRTEAGQDVIRQGEVEHTFYLVLNGELRVNVTDVQAHDVEVNRLQLGDFFGEFACLYNLPRTATVTAAESSLILEFSQQNILELMQRSPLAGQRLAQTIQVRLIHAMTFSHPALCELAAEDRRWVAEESSLFEFDADSAIVHMSEMKNEVYVLYHGRAAIYIPMDGGILRTDIGVNDMFGNVSPFTSLPPAAEIMALERCVVCNIPEHIFHALMNAYGGFEQWVKHDMHDRLRHGTLQAAYADVPLA
ncbi:MAG: cyclic nucleotide-binding domain-containing protein, partial [Mariprofundaceae bacterium]